VDRNEPTGEQTEGAHSAPGPSKVHLKLFVAGGDSRAQAAIANLRRICDEELPDQYEL
jgi:hypothetical protein